MLRPSPPLAPPSPARHSWIPTSKLLPFPPPRNKNFLPTPPPHSSLSHPKFCVHPSPPHPSLPPHKNSLPSFSDHPLHPPPTPKVLMPPAHPSLLPQPTPKMHVSPLPTRPSLSLPRPLPTLSLVPPHPRIPTLSINPPSKVPSPPSSPSPPKSQSTTSPLVEYGIPELLHPNIEQYSAIAVREIWVLEVRAACGKMEDTAFGRPQARYGESDPNPKYTVKSTALDVEELVDQMELGSKFYVMGYFMESRQFGASSSASLIDGSSYFMDLVDIIFVNVKYCECKDTLYSSMHILHSLYDKSAGFSSLKVHTVYTFEDLYQIIKTNHSGLRRYILCNSSDLALECANPHDTRYYPERILLYDKHPGGSCISAQVQPHFKELLTAVLGLLISCHCAGGTGCPNWVQVSFNRVVSSQKEKLFFQSSFVLLILN
ncbi:hypothetical protein GIB67_007126 [Kingdonia uniflora]|uniref:MrfA-like Zn-binding domain-containing protein n=1 Tax=Kingdonia uniflora TaxID=39325 RepID=A0A7J7MLB0_9MAGN|nr:hypothetical protein GIB67_007126 [Kingdonia uniflora]